MSSYSRHARTLSPPLTSTSYSNALTAGQQKLNIVTRLSIEGKSKKGWDGASIKMYLKMSIPLDSVIPGGTISLFPEENLKILDSHVHPLDHNSVPYNFSSTTSPLLHRAARALNLPARSATSYVSPEDSSSSTNLPPLDDKYTGHVLVSGYHVSYVLPKEFPRREHDSRTRRGSTTMLFMAAIDIWVPFLSQPPFAPFLLSIPVPRCLSNHIKLRIFPPGPSAASSLASLSSADENVGAWELASDPHVTRSQPSRLSRSQSYNNFADDESSDASTSAGFAEGCGIQGTFPSTERIRVRWATPLKPGDLPEAADGRRRVGMREVKSDIRCSILGIKDDKGRSGGAQGVLMKLDYTATCKGAWFPGVATLLGLDVALEADDCDISWGLGHDQKWSIRGGTGFTGFTVGGPPPVSRPVASRQSSAEYPPSIYVLPSSPNGLRIPTNGIASRNSSSTSVTSTTSASLLHAPLPAQTVADYSFESTPVTTPTGTVSSLASLAPPSSPERRRRRSSSVNDQYAETETDVDVELDVRPPKLPITIHLNMNELLPPSKNVFTFSISGTLLVTPRSPSMSPVSGDTSPSQSRTPSEGLAEQDAIAVPRFRVLYTDKETISTVIRNETDRVGVHVYNSPANKRDGNTLRTVLMKGNQIACGSDGGRVIVRPLPTTFSPLPRKSDSSQDSDDMSHGRMRMLNGMRSLVTSPLQDTSMMSTARLQPRRDGPLMIPFVTATITPLLEGNVASKNGYAVQVCLPAPSDADTEWLEFGLALPSAEPSTSALSADTLHNTDIANGPPRVEIASASVEGVPVRFQTSAAVKPHASLTGLGLPFEQTSGKEWISWVSVHVGHIGGGRVEVIYLVQGREAGDDAIKDEGRKSEGKQKDSTAFPLDILLPSFALPVGRLQVDIQVQEGFEISSLKTNLIHQQSVSQGRRLLNYALDEFHYPRLCMCIVPASPVRAQPSSKYRTLWKAMQMIALFLPILVVFLLLSDLRKATAELNAVKQSAASYSSLLDSAQGETLETETVTVTTTVLTGGPHRWWFNADNTMVPMVTEPNPPPPPSVPLSTLPSDILQTMDPTTTTPISTIVSSTSALLSTPSEQSALMSAYEYPFPWIANFRLPTLKLPQFELPDVARTSGRTILHRIDSVWQLFRKVIHYPLDPP